MAFIDTKGSKLKDRRYKVDLWLTDLNTVEVGILKQTQHRAKSRQFTKDMDVIGQIKEEGERKGIVAYREGLWKNDNPMQKRLVIKLFSDKMNWRGTMDMMLGRSMQLTHGAGGFPVVSYAINISGHDQVIALERSARQWPWTPERYSFFILTDEGPKFYKLRRKILCMGLDYILYDEHNKKIGLVDGKVITLGGAWQVRVDGAHASKELDIILQLFSAMLRFNDDARRHILQLTKAVAKDRIAPKLGSQETDLYMNPRRTR
ncbi:MAG: hypothetical protein L3J67_06830 [Hyphomicrobiaceae bacterium]|nr:hypothetical protein [Hyphomicrobiaceae bacterium]